MPDNIVYRMMDSEADANKDIGEKSFEHTVARSADAAQKLSSLANQQTGNPLQSGTDVHDELLRRAEQKAFLDSSLGQGSQFRDYKSSMVGSVGQNKDTRRELALRRKQERKAREERFGKRPVPRKNPRVNQKVQQRQSFNATGSTDATQPQQQQQSDRQDYNATLGDQARYNIVFQEPKVRGYDPFK